MEKDPLERRTNDTLRHLVDEKLRELDDRRETNLKFKLDAQEKLLLLTINTKSDALTIAISRIQGDSRECFSRCNTQVALFYSLIQGLKEKNAVYEVKFQLIENRLEKVDGVEEYSLANKVLDLNNWKDLDWKKSLIFAVVTAVTASQVGYWVWEKLFSKWHSP